MQTFVPYPNIGHSALVLDRQRLGKQRVEVLQILNALTGNSKGWVNHPATLMWKGYEPALAAYGVAVCEDWKRRGYKDTCQEKITALIQPSSYRLPSWWGDDSVHSSHRANLLRKFPDYYSHFGWTEDPTMPYIWPTTEVAQ